MPRLFLFFFLLASSFAIAQQGSVVIRKKGRTFKSFSTGTWVRADMLDGSRHDGYMHEVWKDTFSVNGQALAVRNVRKLRLGHPDNFRFHVGSEELMYTTAGVLLSAAGMRVSGWATTTEAIGNSMGLGYGPFVLRFLRSKIRLKRIRFPFRKKFVLQAYDFYIFQR